MPSQEPVAHQEQMPNNAETRGDAAGDNPVKRETVIGGLFIGIAANVAVLLLTFVFYLSVATLPRGTGIRPMWLTAGYFYIGAGSFFLGLPVSLWGAVTCWKSKDKRGVVLGVISAFISAMSLPIALVIFPLITTLLGLHLSE